jgi:hypothetical protein
MPMTAAMDSLAPVPVDDLVGTWHIVQTNFPMWLTGTRTDPTLNYGALHGGSCFEDVVRYVARGKQKEIRGVDTVDPANPAHFRWRGRGLLAPLRSDWYVVHRDLDAGVIAIYFEPTLFTPAGVDIAARSRQPDAAAVATARASLATVPGVGRHLAELSRVP